MIAQAEWLLIGAVAAVGVLHTVVPDHWVPITLIAWQQGWRKRRWPKPRSLPGPVTPFRRCPSAPSCGSPALPSQRDSGISSPSCRALRSSHSVRGSRFRHCANCERATVTGTLIATTVPMKRFSVQTATIATDHDLISITRTSTLKTKAKGTTRGFGAEPGPPSQRSTRMRIATPAQ